MRRRQPPKKPNREEREQPLNVQIGKRGADELFRRRDRADVLQQQIKAARQPDAFRDWVDANFPKFPYWWFPK